MVLDQGDVWLQEVRRCCSPNCDQRPPDVEIDLVVIHNISLPPGEFGGCHIEELFLNQLAPHEHPYFTEIADLQVSAHALIDRQGSVVQFVPFNRRAWHAGKSCYEGRPRCNDFSIGIELEGTDELPYEAVQYQVLASVLEQLFGFYPSLNRRSLTGHSDISPGRKTDPGPAFDWGYLASRFSDSVSS